MGTTAVAPNAQNARKMPCRSLIDSPVPEPAGDRGTSTRRVVAGLLLLPLLSPRAGDAENASSSEPRLPVLSTGERADTLTNVGDFTMEDGEEDEADLWWEDSSRRAALALERSVPPRMFVRMICDKSRTGSPSW